MTYNFTVYGGPADRHEDFSTLQGTRRRAKVIAEQITDDTRPNGFHLVIKLEHPEDPERTLEVGRASSPYPLHTGLSTPSSRAVVAMLVSVYVAEALGVSQGALVKRP